MIEIYNKMLIILLEFIYTNQMKNLKKFLNKKLKQIYIEFEEISSKILNQEGLEYWNKIYKEIMN